MSEPFLVTLDGGERVTALRYPRSGRNSLSATLILAHGAGAGQTHTFMVRAATGLADRGVEVVTFNFPYIERGRSVPDRAPVLEACFRAVIESARARQSSHADRLYIGGKSLGGRIASHLSAADDQVSRSLAGLLCLGYPLHPPGQPTKLRTAHLGGIRAPVLIVQGSRDAFGTPEELRAALPEGLSVEIFVIEGGDHSFKVSKQTATQAEVEARFLDRVRAWMATPAA